MANITEYLIKLQKLTNQNLEILQALNDSFFTKQTHLNVNIGDSNYALPSFISLENKINNLQANFENLINAPATGEAYFNFDGNSRSIEVRSFTHTPNSLKIDNIDKFSVDVNDIFKDFLTPIPYFRIDLKMIPDDITSINIKKIIPKNPELIDRFKSFLGETASYQYNYSDLYKILTAYKENDDYIEYDSTKKMPIRKNIGSGIYVIESIVDDYIDENLDEYITIKLRNDIEDPQCINNLTYKLFDETISKQLIVGDKLITYNNSSKLEIVEILKNTNTIKVKVLYGEYLNLMENKTDKHLDNISDMCKLRFFATVDFNNYKYLNIPLEEDQYVFICAAPLNDRLNVQSSWGTGVMLNTYKLIKDDNDSLNFHEYYEKNVKNVGDLLLEMTSTFTSPVTALTKNEFELLHSKPQINQDDLVVTQINKHLNNATTIQNIRTLYSQKKRYNSELSEIQTSIDNINKQLASISFDDTTGMRSVYTAQLSEYNIKKNELVSSITKIINEISIAANDSTIPIENAKYHIRGFFDCEKFIKSNFTSKDSDKSIIVNNHIIGIDVQYRYKNLDIPQGDTQTIGGKFIYSDWNVMNGFVLKKFPVYDGDYKFTLPENNDDKNEPSFNQIDIPITQGEIVDIKLRVVYDYGYPFIKTTSEWSDTISIEFPEEYLKNIQILDIINENNNDIETNRFTNIISEQGIPQHIGDKITDQDITYFHRPESIASGFYTNERRIIPLKDKLTDMNNDIVTLKDEILGSSSESLNVSVSVGGSNNVLYPFQINNINVESYSEFVNNVDGKTKISNGSYEYNPDTKIVSTVLSLVIKNTSNHTVKLFSIFPGNRETKIYDIKNVKYSKNDYTEYVSNEQLGVWMLTNNSKWKLQTANQFLTFRINNPFDGEKYYKKYNADSELTSSSLPSNKSIYEAIETKLNTSKGTIIYPVLKDEFDLCMDNDTVNTYKLLVPDEEIIIPLLMEYKLSAEAVDNISKTISFDLRTSLYNDLTNYTFKVTAKMNNSTQDKLITSSRKYINGTKYNTIVTK